MESAVTHAFPAPSPLACHWAHDPGVCYLNHGSFGSCPRAVLEAQQRLRQRMEGEGVRFFVEELAPLMDRMRHALGAFVRCPAKDIAPVPNASIGVATVLSGLNLQAGDEILAGSHEYPACMNSLRRLASRTGAKIVLVEIPFPCPDPDAVASAFLGAVTDRTRLALISHVTSSSGMILPVERIVPELERRGVRCLVDGAHAPGMLPWLNVGALGASYYTANCHKWVCSPKGSAFLYVRPDVQSQVRPLALSNNAEKPRPGRDQFLTEFEYVGTQDYTGILAIADAIAFMGALLPGTWGEVMARNHGLCLRARRLICDALGAGVPCPDAMVGSIATIVLPAHEPERHARLMTRPTRYHDALQDALVNRWRIQVPVWGVPGSERRFLRISAQVYNSPAQYEYLANALIHELAAESRL